MRFKDSVWDDSEPDYAPCLKKIRNGYHWVPPRRYIEAGYTLKTYRLEGTVGDALELERARQCRELTRELLDWWEGKTKGRTPDTWGWLIARYQQDEFSSIWDVRPRTREEYRKEMAKIEAAVGNVKIQDTNFERMMTWKRTMEKKGRSLHYIKKWFTHFGLVVSHGIKIQVPHCAVIKAIRSEMRFQTPPARTVFMERQHVNKIVEEADRRRLDHVAIAILFQFEFILRGVDVYGHWSKAEGREGGIQHNNRLWEGGLVWDMFDRELTMFSKVISKTSRSLPEPYHFDLTATPHIRERLMKIPTAKRVGPVIIDHTGRPPNNWEVAKTYRTLKTACGLPDDLQLRDARSGGATEAKTMVDPSTLRDALQHTQQNTTDRYLRGRSDSANKVVKLRQAK